MFRQSNGALRKYVLARESPNLNSPTPGAGSFWQDRIWFLASAAWSGQRDKVERCESVCCFMNSQVPAAYHLPAMDQKFHVESTRRSRQDQRQKSAIPIAPTAVFLEDSEGA